MSVEIETEAQLVPQKKFAESIGRSAQLLTYWRHRNLGPTPTKVGRHFFYTQAAIDEWLARGGNTITKQYTRRT
jgi:hypothetical protein